MAVVVLTSIAIVMLAIRPITENFNTPDEARNGLYCPDRYDWTDETHTNCSYKLDATTTWYANPLCPKDKYLIFGKCLTVDETAAYERNQHLLYAGITVAVTGILSYMSPWLRTKIMLNSIFVIAAVAIFTIYIRLRGSETAFLSLEINTTNTDDYFLQFITLTILYCAAAAFGVSAVIKAIKERAKPGNTSSTQNGGV